MGATGMHSDGVPVVAYCVRRASGPVLAERLADEQFYAASTVKLAVLVAVARALEAGTATLETPLTSTDTFRSEAPGGARLPHRPTMSTRACRRRHADAARRRGRADGGGVVERGDQHGGRAARRDAVNAASATLGATSSSFGRKFSDFAAAAALGGSHRTTAGDLATLMSAIVTGVLARRKWTSWMTVMLGRQHDRQLTAHVPDGVPFGSKSGWVDGIRHDVVFVGEPGPDALVVAVCTRGYEAPDVARN